jgi:hypothetical protein
MGHPRRVAHAFEPGARVHHRRAKVDMGGIGKLALAAATHNLVP